MAALRAYLFLTICLLLAHETLAKNDAPCQLSSWRSGFKTFIKRHLPEGTPTSLNQNEWEKYISEGGSCDRPTQSFLHPKDQERVKAVCTKKGGKTFKDNLCISQEPFEFITVRSVKNTCGIKSITAEKKHLILACEVLDNQCLPIHFEGNPDNEKPNNNARGCGEPQGKSHAPSLKKTWLWLLCVPLLIAYGS